MHEAINFCKPTRKNYDIKSLRRMRRRFLRCLSPRAHFYWACRQFFIADMFRLMINWRSVLHVSYFTAFHQLSTHFRRLRPLCKSEISTAFSSGDLVEIAKKDRKTNALCGLIRFFGFSPIIAHISFHFTLKLIESEICFFCFSKMKFLNKQKNRKTNFLALFLHH